MSAQRERRKADRYQIQDESNREGRFATGYRRGLRHIHKAEIFDVSHLGIGFRTSDEDSPKIGDLIAVEFKLPNSPQMAWFARVVRIELDHIEVENTSNKHVLKIGARFVEMPEIQQKKLENSIDHLLDHTHHEDHETRMSNIRQALHIHIPTELPYWNWLKASLLFIFSIILAFYFINYMKSVGGRELRGSGPAIWPHKDKLPYDQSPWAPDQMPKDDSP